MYYAGSFVPSLISFHSIYFYLFIYFFFWILFYFFFNAKKVIPHN